MELEFDEKLRGLMAERLGRFVRRERQDASCRRAAVALTIVADAEGRACFVLTRRPLTMRRHAGQFALPGGRLDGGETATAAALRETREEVGLTLDEASILGCLDDYRTRSGFLITPVVAWGDAAGALSPNPREVAALYRVPLAELLHPDLVRLDPVPYSEQPVLSLSLLDNRIFAPTAALILQLREVALFDRPTRVSGYGEPRFAWS